MSDVNKIQLRNNVDELTLSKLIPIFQKPNMQKFVSIFTDELQLIENTLLDLLTLRRLGNATGTQLDHIGEELNVYRNGQTDDEFRNIIQIRAFRRTSQGTESDLIQMLQLFTGDQDVDILHVPPYGLTVTYNADCISSPDGTAQLVKFFPLITRLILQEKSEGIGMRFVDSNDLSPDASFGVFANSTGLGNDVATDGAFVATVYTPPDNI